MNTYQYGYIKNERFYRKTIKARDWPEALETLNATTVYDEIVSAVEL